MHFFKKYGKGFKYLKFYFSIVSLFHFCNDAIALL